MPKPTGPSSVKKAYGNPQNRNAVTIISCLLTKKAVIPKPDTKKRAPAIKNISTMPYSSLSPSLIEYINTVAAIQNRYILQTVSTFSENRI